MAKWYGKVVFSETSKTETGYWKPTIIERQYYGDVISNHWKRQTSDKVNDDINISNQISIVSDPYANQHCSSITCVELNGAYWKVTDVEIQYPRLILSIGGLYNGELATATE